MAFALRENCLLLAAFYGIERLGFLTLTFARHIVDFKQAQKALHSLMTGVLRSRYPEYIVVMERMDSGRIHYHLLVVVAQDIRTGFDFAAVKRHDYRSATEYLRQEWAFWRETAEKYGFGRTELLPIKSNAEGIANYVGKYIAKHIGNRLPQDKGARLVRYSRGTNRVSCRFTWHTPGGDLWRTKLGALCQVLNVPTERYPETLREWYGSRWSHALGPIIASIRLVAYPSLAALEKDYPTMPASRTDGGDQSGSHRTAGPWLNPFPEQARSSLASACVVALSERQRRRQRKPCPARAASTCAWFSPSLPAAESSPRLWIHRTARDD